MRSFVRRALAPVAARDRSAAVETKPYTLSRRSFSSKAAVLGIGIGTVVASLPAIAVAERFDPALFEEAQRSGKSIIVGVHADWCSVCAVQKRVIGGVLAKPEFANAVHFHVDYDRDQHALRRFKVLRQSTIIVFKALVETGRLVAVTSVETIEATLRSGL